MSTDAQFSIYKINLDKFNSIDGMRTSSLEEKAKKAIQILLTEIRTGIKEKKGSKQQFFEYQSFKIVVYRTVNAPTWDGMISSLLEEEKGITFALENTNVSYVMLYRIHESVYAMTAGYGSHLIKEYIEKIWGLSLMPKILDDDEGVIRTVRENNMYGEELSISKANRRTTNIKHEKRTDAILQELSLEVDDTIADEFNLPIGKKGKKTSVLLKDSLLLRKPMSILQLKETLNCIYEIEKRKDGYAMGYFCSAKKEGVKKADLEKALVDSIVRKEFDRFTIIGDDYTKYYVEPHFYYLKDEMGNVCYQSSSPISLKEIFEDALAEKVLTNSKAMKTINKWCIIAKRSDGTIVIPDTAVKDMLQAIIEYGSQKIPCFLMQGQWYCLNVKYLSILQSDFEDMVKQNQVETDRIRNKFLLGVDAASEDQFNKSFFHSKNVIVTHKSLIDGYEVSDLLFWDEHRLYLMCNKQRFNGPGSRDLMNQMQAAASYLKTLLFSTSKVSMIQTYYDSIQKKYDSKELMISKDEFVKLFDKQIVFVAGYMEGYSIKARSNYGKFLDLDCRRRMSSWGFEYLSMNVKDNAASEKKINRDD